MLEHRLCICGAFVPNAAVGQPSNEDIDRFPCDAATKQYLRRIGRVDAADLGEKYSAARAACPHALDLMFSLLKFVPVLRVACSQALRHKFLKPGHADLTVDATVGDDGHERVEHTTVKLLLLDIERLQLDGGDRATTGELLMREAELTKLTAVEQVQPG